RYPDIVEITMNGLESSSAFEIEDDIRVAQQHSPAEQYLVSVAQQTTASEISNNGLNPIIRRARKGLVFFREVDFCLNTSCPWRHVARGKHVRKPEPRKTNVVVVEVRDMRGGKIVSINSDVDKNTSRAGQSPSRIL